LPIIFQHRVYRVDLQNNPDVLYLFGDNDERTGYGGQAGEMRDEENAVGVRTKWSPGARPSDYFRDRDFDKVSEMIHVDLERAKEHLGNGGVLVIPADGLGTGLSQLPQRAPRINAFLVEELEKLKDI